MSLRYSLIAFPLITMLLFTACSGKNNESNAHFLKGNNFTFEGDLTNAQKEYNLAINIDEQNWKACFSLAGVYELEGDFKNAIHYFTKALTIKPDFAMCYFQRSMVYDLMGDSKAAKADLEKALSLKKDLFMAQLTLAQKLYAAEQYRQALSAIDGVIATRSDYFLAFSMRGSCRMKLGDPDGAIEDFKTELALNPGNVTAYANIAVAYAQKKDYRSAIREIDRVLIANPQWSQGYLSKGMYYYNLNIKDTACDNFRFALKLKDPNADSYVKMYCK